MSHPEELLAYWLVSQPYGWSEGTLAAYDLLLGERKGNVAAFVRFLRARRLDDETFREARAGLLADWPPPRIPDLVAVEPLGPSFRLIPPSELHEEVLFEDVGQVLDGAPPRSSGVLLAAALGSPVARDLLSDRLREALDQILPESLLLDRPRSLHERYLACLSLLFIPPEPDAPAFLRSTAWQRKTTQTVAASWAQSRHTWILQAGFKKAVFGGRHEEFLGFLEPVPRFHAEFTELVHGYRRAFEDASLFWDGEGEGEEVIVETEEDLEPPRSGEPPLDEDAPAFGEGRVFTSGSALRRRWDLLGSLCERMEYMTYKQLRGVSWSPREADFFTGLGSTLCRIADPADTHRSPTDDAPRAVPVWEDPFRNEVWHAAVGRPQWIYVLYPWRGDQILCRGAVMPYHEFVTDERWTDARWMEELDRADGLARTPSWLEPVMLR